MGDTESTTHCPRPSLGERRTKKKRHQPPNPPVLTFTVETTESLRLTALGPIGRVAIKNKMAQATEPSGLAGSNSSDALRDVDHQGRPLGEDRGDPKDLDDDSSRVTTDASSLTEASFDALAAQKAALRKSLAMS